MYCWLCQAGSNFIFKVRLNSHPVPKKYFKKWLPSHDAIRQHRWLLPLGTRLQHPNLWHLHRRSVSGGVAVGLFCGLIPGPLQMLGSALLAVLFRVNLPVAMFTTLYTNPFTILPLYWLAYQLGVWVTGHHDGMTAAQFSVPEMSWGNWFTVLTDWFFSLGQPFIIGLLLLAISLSVLGYLMVRIGWRLWVIWQWRKRSL